MRPRQLRAVKIGQTALDAFRALDTEDEQNALAGAIVRYCLDGKEPARGVSSSIVWKMIVSEIERIRKAEEAISEARAAAGRRGGFAKAAAAADTESAPPPEPLANVANASNCQQLPQVLANVANVAKLAIREEENRKEEIRVEESRYNAPPRAASGARSQNEGEAETPPPVTLEEATGMGERTGLTPEEVKAWFVHYGAQRWRFKPGAQFPMNRQDVVFSLANWRTRRDEFAAKARAAEMTRKAETVSSYIPPSEEARHADY